jgi:hypothetical protein
MVSSISGESRDLGCDDESPYAGGSHAWRPSTVNAGGPLIDSRGEIDRKGDRVLIDDLTDLPQRGAVPRRRYLERRVDLGRDAVLWRSR